MRFAKKVELKRKAEKPIQFIFSSLAILLEKLDDIKRRKAKEKTYSEKKIAKAKEGFKEGRPKKFTSKQLDHALSMLSINGGSYSYSEVEEITNISKSTLTRECRKRKNIKSN